MNKFHKGLGLSALLVTVAAAQFACNGDGNTSSGQSSDSKQPIKPDLVSYHIVNAETKKDLMGSFKSITMTEESQQIHFALLKQHSDGHEPEQIAESAIKWNVTGDAARIESSLTGNRLAIESNPNKSPFGNVTLTAKLVNESTVVIPSATVSFTPNVVYAIYSGDKNATIKSYAQQLNRSESFIAEQPFGHPKAIAFTIDGSTAYAMSSNVNGDDPEITVIPLNADGTFKSKYPLAPIAKGATAFAVKNSSIYVLSKATASSKAHIDAYQLKDEKLVTVGDALEFGAFNEKSRLFVTDDALYVTLVGDNSALYALRRESDGSLVRKRDVAHTENANALSVVGNAVYPVLDKTIGYVNAALIDTGATTAYAESRSLCMPLHDLAIMSNVVYMAGGEGIVSAFSFDPADQKDPFKRMPNVPEVNLQAVALTVDPTVTSIYAHTEKFGIKRFNIDSKTHQIDNNVPSGTIPEISKPVEPVGFIIK